MRNTKYYYSDSRSDALTVKQPNSHQQHQHSQLTIHNKPHRPTSCSAIMHLFGNIIFLLMHLITTFQPTLSFSKIFSVCRHSQEALMRNNRKYSVVSRNMSSTTPTTKLNAITSEPDPKNVLRPLVICGPSGVGKSKCHRIISLRVNSLPKKKTPF